MDKQECECVPVKSILLMESLLKLKLDFVELQIYVHLVFFTGGSLRGNRSKVQVKSINGQKLIVLIYAGVDCINICRC